MAVTQQQMITILRKMPLPKSGGEARNFFIGTCEVLCQSGFGGDKIRGWLKRRGDLKLAPKIGTKFDTVRARRMLSGLRALAISSVEACAWVGDYLLGALPVQDPRVITQARREAISYSLRAARARQAEERERKIQDRKERLSAARASARAAAKAGPG